jgi:hypothetical protein
LDFRKAFDTVSSEYLEKILTAIGFDRKWIKWMNMLTATGKTVVLLNGIPSPWILIKRGLRQGDLLSPLLFILIKDVLLKTIKKFSEGGINHPIVLDLTCLVIWYADDTLILFQGCLEQAKLLKEILDAYSSTTSLTINYIKSTFVPINLEE